MNNNQYFLAGDIGGTKTNLGYYSLEKGPYDPLEEASFKSGDYDSLEEIVNIFLPKKEALLFASFGVAGPVFDGQVKITKLNWQLSEAVLQKKINIPQVFLLNDLTATGHSLPLLKETDYLVVNIGIHSPKSNKVIIAPGTGLGETFLSWNKLSSTYEIHSSEAGHALFAPGNEIQINLLKYLYEHHGDITYDKICSGLGISLIFDFLKNKHPELDSNLSFDNLSSSKDITPAIVESANMTIKPTAASKAIEIFVEILAAEAANATLRALASGGVYLAGGIPPRLKKYIQQGNFMDVFTSRKPFSDYLSDIPIKLILNPKAALIGAAAHGIERTH